MKKKFVDAKKKTVAIDEVTHMNMRETQLLLWEKTRVEFDLKDIMYMVFSSPAKITELIEGNSL